MLASMVRRANFGPLWIAHGYIAFQEKVLLDDINVDGILSNSLRLNRAFRLYHA